MRYYLSRTGYHDACHALVRAHARIMCGRAVLCWVLKSEDVS